MRDTIRSLKLVIQSIEAGMSEDFFSIDLRNAYASLGRMIGEEVEDDLVEEIFSHPKSQVAKELISKDSGNDVESKKLTQSEIQDGEIVRIVFSENSAFEPVIANLILTFHEPVNILKANTKNVGGVAKGEMILQFMSDSTNVPEMKKFLTERGLEIGEAN